MSLYGVAAARVGKRVVVTVGEFVDVGEAVIVAFGRIVQVERGVSVALGVAVADGDEVSEGVEVRVMDAVIVGGGWGRSTVCKIKMPPRIRTSINPTNRPVDNNNGRVS